MPTVIMTTGATAEFPAVVSRGVVSAAAPSVIAALSVLAWLSIVAGAVITFPAVVSVAASVTQQLAVVYVNFK